MEWKDRWVVQWARTRARGHALSRASRLSKVLWVMVESTAWSVLMVENIMCISELETYILTFLFIQVVKVEDYVKKVFKLLSSFHRFW